MEAVLQMAIALSKTAIGARILADTETLYLFQLNHRLGPIGFSDFSGVDGEEVCRVGQCWYPRFGGPAEVGTQQHRTIRR